MDGRRKAVPDTRSGNGKCSIFHYSDVVVRGMSSIMLAADCRTTAAGKTEVVGQIARCSAVQALVNQCRQLKSDALSHRQPMK